MKNKSLLDRVVLIVLSIFLLTPLIFTIIYSFTRDFTGLFPKGFTPESYTHLFLEDHLLVVILRTLLISLVPVLISMMVILLAIFASLRYYPKGFRYLDFVTKIPYGIQGVILAASILALYTGRGGIFSNRVLLLSCAYIIFVFPYLYQGAKSALFTVPVDEILDAAEILGERPIKAYFTIVVASVYRGLLSTTLLSAGLLFSDFVLVNMIAGSFYPTLGIVLNRTLRQSGAKAAAISTILSLIMFALSYGVNALSRDKRKQSEEIIHELYSN